MSVNYNIQIEDTNVVISDDSSKVTIVDQSNVVSAVVIGNPVYTVNGQSGDVVLTTTDVAEGTNLYYTHTRFNNSLAAIDTDDITEGLTNKYFTQAQFDTNIAAIDTDDITEGLTNKYYSPSLFNTDFAAKSTTDLSEGTNLYYTAARANTAIDTRVNKTFVDLLNVDADTLDGQQGTFYLDYANFTNTPTIPTTTTQISEGINLYYTDGRVNARIDARVNKTFVDSLGINATQLGGQLPAHYLDYNNFTNTPSIPSTTDDITEGLTNKYFTEDRVDSRVSGLLVGGDNITLAYDALAGTLTITGQPGYTTTDFNTDFAAKSTTDLSEGTNLYFTNERVDDRVANLLVAGDNITLSYNDVANTLTITGQPGYTTTDFNTDFATKTTDGLSEGTTNLYFSTARANTAIDARVDKAFVDLLGVNAATLGGTAASGFATSAQGALADTALQPAAIGVSVQGYSLVLANTTASYTTAEQTKLSGIETGAQANTVDSVNTQTGAVVLTKADVGLSSVENYAMATQLEAETGTSTTTYMSPQRTRDFVENGTYIIDGGTY